MPKKGTRNARKPVGDPNDPEGSYRWMQRYLEAMRVKNYAERTVGNRESYLGFFILWCEARTITRPQEVTKPIIDRYQRHLFHMRKPSGKPLSFSAQLAPSRACAGLLQVADPAERAPVESDLGDRAAPAGKAPAQARAHGRRGRAGDAAARHRDPIGLRDRAILETLYSTGIRRMEVINLTAFDLDQERDTLMVRQGKGKKDRMVQIGERAVTWIGKYLDEARPKLVLPPDPGTLFVTQEGEEISPHRLAQLVRTYIRAAETGKTGSCHLFRHTCATLMLEGGADIRYIQEMLGHVELSTTQIYTQVSIRRLKAVHALTHPSAKIERPGLVEGENPDASGQCAPGDAIDEADDTTAIARPALSPEDAKAALSPPWPPKPRATTRPTSPSGSRQRRSPPPSRSRPVCRERGRVGVMDQPVSNGPARGNVIAHSRQSLSPTRPSR